MDLGGTAEARPDSDDIAAKTKQYMHHGSAHIYEQIIIMQHGNQGETTYIRTYVYI